MLLFVNLLNGLLVFVFVCWFVSVCAIPFVGGCDFLLLMMLLSVGVVLVTCAGGAAVGCGCCCCCCCVCIVFGWLCVLSVFKLVACAAVACLFDCTRVCRFACVSISCFLSSTFVIVCVC